MGQNVSPAPTFLATSLAAAATAYFTGTSANIKTFMDAMKWTAVPVSMLAVCVIDKMDKSTERVDKRRLIWLPLVSTVALPVLSGIGRGMSYQRHLGHVVAGFNGLVCVPLAVAGVHNLLKSKYPRSAG